jgi:hypothetical protein
MKNVEPLTVKCDDPLLVRLFPVTRQCLIIRQIAGLALRFTASHVQEGGCSQSYPQKVGIEIFHATSFSVSTGLLRFDFLELCRMRFWRALCRTSNDTELKDISLLDGYPNEAYRIFVGGVYAPREYGSSGDRALRMVCRTSLYWEA